MQSEAPWESRWTIRRIATIHEISSSDWNACVPEEQPFLRHEFFQCLEDSGTACPRTGWQPCHLLLQIEGRTMALAPLFLKNHSEGEFIFDYGWAAAYERVGQPYYPKLQSAVPYTPVTGPRYLVHPEHPDPAAARMLLRRSQRSLAQALGASSLHVTFCDRDEFGSPQPEEGWLPRLSMQFHFENRGYTDFADYLAALSARKRKAVIKERRAVVEAGITIEVLTGADILPEHIEVLYQCYQDTSSRKWGRAALTKKFFRMLRERMPERVVLMLARKDSRYVAAALNFRGSQGLFGRNWGCLEDVPFLHFELCYYQAIEYAIKNGLARVEAGAQGFHKVSRGYLPRLTYSLHWIAHPAFREAISRAVELEGQEIAQECTLIEQEHSPFRRL